MGIDMTPTPDNPNTHDATVCALKIDIKEEDKERIKKIIDEHIQGPLVLDDRPPRDHIIYESQDGNIFYQYDTTTDTFVILNLPMFMHNAPERVKTETVIWVRQCIAAEREGKEKPKSQIIREYLDDPKTKVLRRSIKRGYASLEDFA